jgi:predicted RNA binding protein YcfA (HicA-like mRNA interferase family)
MESYSPQEVIKILQENNWYEKRARGGHHIFANKNSNNIVVVSISKNNIPIGTLKNIEKQSGIKFN